MKRLVYIVATIGILSIGGRYAAAQFVEGYIKELLQQYDIETKSLSCAGGFISRTGYCFFQLNRDVAYLKQRLDQDLSAKQPKHQNVMNISALGSGMCRDSFFGHDPILARTQLGGGSLPYIGSIYFNEGEHRGCIEFEFGYG